MTWTAIQAPDRDDEVHVIPDDDLIRHLPEGCPCGPRTEPVAQADGSMGWVEVHHSLDGREQHEKP